MHKLITGALVALLIAAAPAVALADAAGTAKGVNPEATGVLDGITRTLVVGTDIFLGDQINTGPAGQVQILFADNTRLVVGPHSSLTIEDYLVRNDGSAGKFVVDMLSGSFRFATGNAPKNQYEINTPTGTIGIRGTGFDTFVDAVAHITRIIIYHGRIRYCSISGECEEISDLCTLGQFDSTDAVILGDTHEIKGDERQDLKTQFIYAENEAKLLREFWMKGAYDCLHNPPAPDPEDDGGPSEGSEATEPSKPPVIYRGPIL